MYSNGNLNGAASLLSHTYYSKDKITYSFGFRSLFLIPTDATKQQLLAMLSTNTRKRPLMSLRRVRSVQTSKARRES